jgi:hypothetical protein
MAVSGIGPECDAYLWGRDPDGQPWLLMQWENEGWYSCWVPARAAYSLPRRTGKAEPDEMIRVLLPADRDGWPQPLAREETVHLGVVPSPLQLPPDMRRR